MSSQYVRFDDPKVEPEVANEEGLKKEIQELITRFQANNFSSHRHGFRGTHVKTQGIVKGTFTVTPNLPSHLSHGICSVDNAKKAHDVAIRFANEPSFLQDDRTPGPRGLGLRIFNITGDFLDPIGAHTHTQDLTFNNAPILELTDLPTTVSIFQIRERNFHTPDNIASEMKRRPDADLQMAPSQLPNQHFLSYTMYSQSAFRWGPYVAKYALFPAHPSPSDLSTYTIDPETSDPEQHSRWLREYFRANSACYDLRIQLCRDISKQSVEDCSGEWDEAEFPFETVGRIEIPSQDSFRADRRTFWEDRVKLNVWYGLEEHRPLGSVNRLRKELYAVSARNRADMNAQEVVDVDSVDRIP